jgi:hypothetical protein
VYLTLGTYVSGPWARCAAAPGWEPDVDALVTVGPEGDLSVSGLCPARAGRAVRSAGCAAAARRTFVAHHGGSGTMLGALSHGLTQLLLPHGADQFMNAKALLDSGAGRCLLPRNHPRLGRGCSTRAARRARIYREAAGGLAIEIAAMPAPADPKLEQLLAPVWATLTACVHAQPISRRSRRR